MFEILDRRTSLTGNQIKILVAAIIGDALEFFDYFLIGFVLAFLIGPWKLTFGQSATVLMSSGIGAILGAYVWGWLADRIGRRKVFIGTVLNFSIATGLLYFTPDNGWIYLSVMRFFVGVGVGGLYCVDLPLVQEFMPSSKRGWVGGLVYAARAATRTRASRLAGRCRWRRRRCPCPRPPMPAQLSGATGSTSSNTREA
jgi:putative MFS transporter